MFNYGECAVSNCEVIFAVDGENHPHVFLYRGGLSFRLQPSEVEDLVVRLQNINTELKMLGAVEGQDGRD